MAKYSKYLFLLTSSLLLLTSCQEGGDAGDLFGQWRMKGSDTQYISFSGPIVEFRSINEGEVFGNFQHVGDSLFIQCYSIYEDPVDTLVIENTFGFKPLNNIRLQVTTLDDDNLVLVKDNRIWSFYKY